ncbi:hypothetical protein [Nostoc punctiforme]|uniref:hypothetical protein n=1 Tax=Nostoc punctiforme TaxID=272131 RepID=UPI000045BB8A|nr:hypothetical protein [Nostoc punctiforme]
MYTTAKVAEPWRSLFPKIKESTTSIEVTVRGQSFTIEIPKRRSQVTTNRNLQFR